MAESRSPATTAPGGADVVLSGVTRLFGATPALVRVDLRVDLGEVIVLCGPNGAGKSTLLRILATEIAPTFGRGSVLGFDLENDRHQIRQRTEFLGHRSRLYEDLTAEENLRFWALLCVAPAEPGVSASLDRVGLRQRAGERARHLSQGMRQRLALARAFLRRPEILLLDEPYAGLDPDGKGLVDWLVLDAKDEGRTVILATHDVSRAELVADRVIGMRGGRVVSDQLLVTAALAR